MCGSHVPVDDPPDVLDSFMHAPGASSYDFLLLQGSSFLATLATMARQDACLRAEYLVYELEPGEYTVQCCTGKPRTLRLGGYPRG